MTDSVCNPAPVDSSELKKGEFVLIKGRPCKIVEVFHATTGKHGHTKVRLVGIDLLNDRKHEWMGAGHLKLHTFAPVRKAVVFCSVDENEVSCLDENNNLLGMKLPEDENLRERLRAPDCGGNILILTAPVEKSEDVFVDETRIEGIKDAKE